MADAISTLALKVESAGAIAGLQNFGNAANRLGGEDGALTGKIKALGAAYLSWNMGKSLLADAAYGQEALGKFEQVLGRFTKDANAMVDDLVANFNFNKADAQQAIATMTDTFVKSGITMRKALDMTGELQKLAGDLEAFTNAEGGVSSVAAALNSAILGNYMSVKRLGIVMNDEMVKAQMAEDALNGLRYTTEQEAKECARFAIIQKQTAAAQGQVARESDNYSNKQRKLKAVVADLRGELGDALIPVATKVTDILISITSTLEKTSPTTKTAIVGLGALTSAFITLGVPIAATIKGFKTASAVQQIAAATTGKATAAATSNTAAEGANATASNVTTAAKEREAAARTHNATAIAAENAALNSQSTANIASAATGGMHHAPGKRAKLGNLAANAMYFMPSGGKVAKGFGHVGARALGATSKAALGGAAAKGALGRTVSNALGAIGNGLGKTAGVISKPFGKLNGLFVSFGRLLGGLVGKLPFLTRFAGLFIKLGSGLVPFVGWAATAITALQAFKHMPEYFEKFLDETWPKIKDFAAEIPGHIVEGAKLGWNKLKDLGGKTIDFIGDGLLGAAQTLKRMAGFETAASQAYKINKQIEQANARRQELLDIESKQRESEAKQLDSITNAKKAQLRADAKYAASKNDDQSNLAVALQARDKTKGELNAKNQALAKNSDELNALALTRSQIINQKKKNDAIKEQAYRKAEILDATVGGGTGDAERKKADARYAENEEFLNKQLAQIESREQEINDASSALSQEIETLAESLETQNEEVDKLAETVANAAKAAEQDQRDYAKQLEADERNKADQEIQNQRDNAKNHQERLAALRADWERRNEKVEEAEAAQGIADEKNEEIKKINESLNSEIVANNLAKLQTLAESGDTSQNAELDYVSILTALEKAGYNTEDNQYFGEHAASSLLQSINEQRKGQREQLETLTTERNDAQTTASEYSSRLADLQALERETDEENKTFNQGKEERTQDDEKRTREQEKLGRQREDAFKNEMFQRQLTAIESSGMNGYDVAASKYDLIAGKGMDDWNAAQERLQATGEEINTITSQIDELRKKEEEGTATEADIAKRQELEGRRDELQSEYDSDYDKALSDRWNTEKELFGLQQTMAEEQDKQIRDYVTEQGDALKKNLEEQAAAAEAENQKRLEERSEVEKEQRQAVSGAKAIAAGSSEAFAIQSKIYDRGQENLPPEKKIEKSTEKIEKYVSQMQEQLYQYLSGNASITLSMGY